MSRQTRQNRGIVLNDWVTLICLGLLFFLIGAITLSMLLAVDPAAATPLTLTKQPASFVFVALVTTGLLDLGAMCVIWGWKGRHNASTISLSADHLGRRNNFMNVDNPFGMATDGASTSEEQKAVKSISDGMSLMFKIYLWAQRISAVIVVIVVFLFAAIWWLLSVLDLITNNRSLNFGIFLPLGLAFLCYIAIIYFMLLRKPAAPNMG